MIRYYIIHQIKFLIHDLIQFNFHSYHSLDSVTNFVVETLKIMRCSLIYNNSNFTIHEPLITSIDSIQHQYWYYLLILQARLTANQSSKDYPYLTLLISQ